MKYYKIVYIFIVLIFITNSFGQHFNYESNFFEKDHQRIQENPPNDFSGYQLSPIDKYSLFKNKFHQSLYKSDEKLIEPSNSYMSMQSSSMVGNAWERYFASGLSLSDIYTLDIAVDDYENVYIAGYTTSLPFEGLNYFTAKYDSSGNLIWTSLYNGPGNSEDIAVALTIDASGNVYVTGQSYGLGSGKDLATVKYNSAGIEQWVARYSSQGNNEDIANGIAIDGFGNIFINGYRHSEIGGLSDYVTIKYNTLGIEQWVSIYNGPGNSDDIANDIAVNDLGYVYVTGSSHGLTSSVDYATIKYNASGVEQWVARYNGPANYEDVAFAIDINNMGNVCVTGASVGLSLSYDYLTIKYDSDGTEQWVVRYSSPTDWSWDVAVDIAIDGSDNIYITGYYFGSSPEYINYLTFKYNSSGVIEWMAEYDGPGSFLNHEDYAVALEVDNIGNVYVTGISHGQDDYDYATVKYNTYGIEQWVKRYDGTFTAGVAVDKYLNAYITGKSYEGCATVKYNSFGDEKWDAQYNRQGDSKDYAKSIVVDDTGNIYVTGSSYSLNTNFDYATIKYNTSGVEQWVVRYNGPANDDDEPYAIAIDNAGNIYVTGKSKGVNSKIDYATIKYNTSGVEQWIARYNGPANNDDVSSAISVDYIGNVYVTGSSYNSSYGLTSSDYTTIKYNPSGIEQWVVRYNGTGNSLNFANTLILDGNGNVYITGYSYGLGTGQDMATIKYDTYGIEKWVARYNGPANNSDGADALVVDSNSNVYITGYSYGLETNQDITTIKYDAYGIEKWVARYNDSGNSRDFGKSIALDSEANLYVMGNKVDFPNGNSITIKYNTLGNQQWIAKYGGSSGYGYSPIGLVIDSFDNIFITGTTNHQNFYTTIMYDKFGTKKWFDHYKYIYSEGSSRDVHCNATAIAVDVSGNIFVTGTIEGSTQILPFTQSLQHWSIYTTIKYSHNQVSSNEELEEKPSSYFLSQNYPNPFNPTTTIRYSIPKSCLVLIKVFDLLGREIATLINEDKIPGSYEVNFDASNLSSGVYFYKLQADNFTQTKKLLVLK